MVSRGGGGGTGIQLTYNFNLATSALGYDLNSVIVYGGWNDNGRDQLLYNISYATVGNPTGFIPLAPGTVNFNPVVPANQQSATRATTTDNAATNLATGVSALRFDFPGGVENGYTGYAELDAIGSPTIPEPTSAALLFLGTTLLGARRARR